MDIGVIFTTKCLTSYMDDSSSQLERKKGVEASLRWVIVVVPTILYSGGGGGRIVVCSK